MKLDLYKVHKADYIAPKKPVLVQIAKASYLTVDGEGHPDAPMFSERIGALYKAAFTVKMAGKRAGNDYLVCKLEGLWWVDEGKFDENPPENWRWKLIIRTPEFITAKHLKEAKVNGLGVRLEKLAEGRCVQMLHVGPYTAEQPTLAAMAEYAASQGLQFSGRHHEIYITDPKRVAPERLKTILRLPVAAM